MSPQASFFFHNRWHAHLNLVEKKKLHSLTLTLNFLNFHKKKLNFPDVLRAGIIAAVKKKKTWESTVSLRQTASDATPTSTRSQFSNIAKKETVWVDVLQGSLELPLVADAWFLDGLVKTGKKKTGTLEGGQREETWFSNKSCWASTIHWCAFKWQGLHVSDGRRC